MRRRARLLKSRPFILQTYCEIWKMARIFTEGTVLPVSVFGQFLTALHLWVSSFCWGGIAFFVQWSGWNLGATKNLRHRVYLVINILLSSSFFSKAHWQSAGGEASVGNIEEVWWHRERTTFILENKIFTYEEWSGLWKQSRKFWIYYKAKGF